MAILSLFDPETLHLMLESPLVLLYVGPDQILPFASVLSAIAGLALMFWNRLVSFVVLCWSLVTGRGRPVQPPPQPASGGEAAD